MKLGLACLIFTLIFCSTVAIAQSKKTVYHPCALIDSLDKHLAFIPLNTSRIFVDSFDCRQTLLDSIASKYLRTHEQKYLEALSAIRVNGAERVEDLYTDIIARFAEKDFTGFVNDLYLAKGKYLPLEKELVATLNMMINGKPYKNKFMAVLQGQITKANEAKDKYKISYLEKLKQKIELDKY